MGSGVGTTAILTRAGCRPIGRYVSPVRPLPRIGPVAHPGSRGGDPVVTIVCEPDRPYAERIASGVDGEARVVTTLQAAARALSDSDDASVLVIGPGHELEPVLVFVAALPLSNPDVRVVLVREDSTDRAVDRALALGVREVVVAQGNVQ